MGYINPKGAEWSKWDLHVHTPASLVQHFKATEEKDVWEKYISDLESLPAEFKVIGINDYLFLDGYRKVQEYKRAGRLDITVKVYHRFGAKFTTRMELL